MEHFLQQTNTLTTGIPKIEMGFAQIFIQTTDAAKGSATCSWIASP